MSGNYGNWEAVIGLEVHAQLSTKTKLFSNCPIEFGAANNDRVTPICAAHPGTLPALNEKAVKYAVMAALGVGATIRNKSVFSRKNYFYPDLPKGYQISQYDEPLCEGGKVTIDLKDSSREINLTRIHMEEDAGKSVHESSSSLVNLNRAGTPLIEIVSEPEMRTPEEAGAYLRKLHAIVTYLGICDGNMQEGNFRCDANVSVRPKGQEKFGTRAELKNLNSFRFVEKAIEYEISRQIDLIENGGEVAQETRTYDSNKGTTSALRSKEEAHDYRYFPEPDLVWLKIDDAFINDIKGQLPELPDAKKARLMEEYSLPGYDAGVITSNKSLADFFEKCLNSVGASDAKTAKVVSNWMMTELLRVLNEENLEPSESKITPEQLGQMIQLIQKGTISGKIAKQVFEKMWETQKSPKDLVSELGLTQISDQGEIEAIIDQVIAENPNQLEQYRSGKDKLFGFFVGQVMKKSQGKANPGLVNQILKNKL